MLSKSPLVYFVLFDEGGIVKVVNENSQNYKATFIVENDV